MNKPLQAVVIVACVILIIFDIALLVRNSRNEERIKLLSEENATLRNKDPLMIEEIFSLFEHRLEGRDLAPLLDKVRQRHPGFASWTDERERLRTLMMVPDPGAMDRVRKEIEQWSGWSQACPGAGVQPAILVAAPADEAPSLTARLRDLSQDIAIDQERDWSDSLVITSDPVFLILGRNDHVIQATVSKVGDLQRSRKFFERLSGTECSNSAW